MSNDFQFVTDLVMDDEKSLSPQKSLWMTKYVCHQKRGYMVIDDEALLSLSNGIQAAF